MLKVHPPNRKVVYVTALTGRIETFTACIFVAVQVLVIVSRIPAAVPSVPVATTVIIFIVATLVPLEF